MRQRQRHRVAHEIQQVTCSFAMGRTEHNVTDETQRNRIKKDFVETSAGSVYEFDVWCMCFIALTHCKRDGERERDAEIQLAR